jgi:hypothetical protein
VGCNGVEVSVAQLRFPIYRCECCCHDPPAVPLSIDRKG